MAEPLRLTCILAHPDDESLGTGGTLAKCAAEGIETSLVTATRGQRGWKGPPEAYPGLAALGETRQRELEAAADVLGVGTLVVLDHVDGELDRVDARRVSMEIAAHVRALRPHVVVTFGPDGVYGHPDHIAISQFATAAVMLAADAGAPVDGAPHCVSKLYFMAASRDLIDAYQGAFGAFDKQVDGRSRRAVAWPDWALTTRLDAREHTATVWRAIACHRSQLRDFERLERLTHQQRMHIFGEQTYYRAFSLVNGGRALEDDVFAGLR
jgi:LmbE family N-acetylglucosaminyl deacetylase